MGRASKESGARQSAAVVESLGVLGTNGSIRARDAKYYGLMIEEVLASASQCVLEGLDEHEMQLASRSSKQRLKLEKKVFGA